VTTSLEPPATAVRTAAEPAVAGPGWVGRAALAVAIGGLVLKGWVAFRGYFLVDDFIFQARAAREPFLSNLLTEHAGHVMPGGMLVAWLTTEAAPLNHTAAVVTILAAVATSYALCWRMLTTLVGARPAALVPFVFYCFTPLLLPATVWWAAALNALPLQMAGFAAVTAYVRLRRTGDVRQLTICLLAVAAGLLFFEKAVLVPVVVAGAALALSPERSLVGAARAELAARWPLWLGIVGLGLGYLVWYLATPKAAGFGSSDDPGAVADLVSGSLGTAVGPSLVGGPWSWVPVGTAGGIGDAPSWAGWLAVDLVLVLVVATSLLRRRARRIWATLAVVLLADLTVLSVSRLFIGAQIGLELRYFADAAVPAVLALTLATLTPLGEAPDALSHKLSSLLSSPGRSRAAFGAASLAGVVFVGGAVGSAIGYDRVWSPNPAREYVTSAKAGLSALPPGSQVLEQTVPPVVLDALTAPRNTTGWVFAPLRDGPSFGDTATESWQVADTGEVRLQDVQGIRSRPGPAEGCGWPVGPDGGSVRLGTELFAWPWVLRIEYLSGADTDAVVHLGEARQAITFRKGLGTLLVRLTGEGDRVRFDRLEAGSGVCVDTVRVGTLADR